MGEGEVDKPRASQYAEPIFKNKFTGLNAKTF